MSENRKLLIIQTLAKGPKTMKEIIRDTGIPQTSAYRNRNLLIKDGIIAETPNKLIALTTEGRLKYAGFLKN